MGDYVMSYFDNKDESYKMFLGAREDSLSEMKTINKKKFIKALDKEVEELRTHFKEDGWDIDANHILSNVLYNILGFHLEDEFKAYVNNKLGTLTEYSMNKYPVFCLPRTFVFYDDKKDKLTTSKKYKKNLRFIGVL